MTREAELETNCELVWCKINIKGSKTLHVGAFYRPDISDSVSLGELASSLSRVPTNHSIVLGGDFNLPGCDWQTCQIKPGTQYQDHHTELFDMTHDFVLTQHITDPTRTDPFHGTSNTLDLILTNRPNSISSTSVLPGISDHDAAQIDLESNRSELSKNPEKSPCTKKQTGAISRPT